MAIYYAKGPYDIRHTVPSSAFSKGDLLVLTSNSSISRAATSTNSLGAIANGTIAGVAMASSLDSIANLVPWLVAYPATVYWSDATSGSQMTPGEKLDFEYTGATFRVTTSAITPIAMIDPNGASQDVVGQSTTSRVKIMLDPTFLLFRS